MVSAVKSHQAMSYPPYINIKEKKINIIAK